MSQRKHPPRLQVDISEEQKELLDTYLKWGVGAPFWRAVVDDVIGVLSDETIRKKVIGNVMAGKLKVSSISEVFK